jgi:hypothetical protein
MTDYSEVITVAAFAMSAATFWIGRQTSSKKEGESAGAQAKDIEYIKQSVNRIESSLTNSVMRLEGRIDEQSGQLLTVATTSADALSSTKSAHHRIDEHLEREHGIKTERR